jgi:hypothetical protein
MVKFHPVQGANHFSILTPLTRPRRAEDPPQRPAGDNISFAEQELNALFAR